MRALLLGVVIALAACALALGAFCRWPMVAVGFLAGYATRTAFIHYRRRSRADDGPWGARR